MAGGRFDTLNPRQHPPSNRRDEAHAGSDAVHSS